MQFYSTDNLHFETSVFKLHLTQPWYVFIFLLQDEKDFRDKLSSIYVSFNYTLDPNAAADSHGLRPILNYQTTNIIEQKVF